MICSDCGVKCADDQCPKCGSEAVLVERYQLREVLGRRGAATTFLARDLETGEDVVVKELMLRATESLKEIELFAREAELLQQLEHPSIPSHLAHFECRRGKSISLYNVQEHVEGVSLERRLGSHRYDEAEVLDIVAKVAATLAYLRECNPPIVHRDLKPANILSRDDGELMLVDFGAARAIAEKLHASGSTVTGTFGYMAPEQLLGRAEPASDVYALGATAIRLLSGREPHSLLDTDGRFAWREHANVSVETADLVDAMTAQEPHARPAELDLLAQDARAAASGSGRALIRYRDAALTVSKAKRPTTGEIVQRVWRDPIGRHGLLLPIPVFLYALLASLLPVVFLNPIALVLSIFFYGTYAATYGRRLGGPLRAAWLLRTGAVVRGIVTRRENNEEGFVVTYQFRLSDDPRVERAVLGPDIYLQCPPGTEVDVFYKRDKPPVSTIAPIQ